MLRAMSSRAHPFRSEAARERYLAAYELRSAAWPVPSATRTVPTSFGQTFVRTSGPGDGPPLVLLPGVGSTSLSFADNVKDLSTRFATYAVDNIHDHGRSIESETHPVTNADDYAAWLDELFTALGLGDEINLLGLSYGGWIAAHYALRFPQRTRRLVLLAPAGTLAPIPWGCIWRAVLCALPSRFFMRNFVRWVAAELDDDPSRSALLEQMVDDAYLATRSFRARRMVPPIPLHDDQWRALAVPTLLLAGDAEVIFPASESLARVAALAPMVETYLLPGAGHDFFVARAPEVNRRIAEFLEARAA